MTDRNFGHITFGQELAKFEVGGFVLTETYHPPFMKIPRHDHEGANINFTIEGSFRETIGSRPSESHESVFLVKPECAVHANDYGEKGAHCLIIEVQGKRLSEIRPFSDLFDKPDHFENAFLARFPTRIVHELHDPAGPSPILLEGLILELLAYASKTDLTGRCSQDRWLESARRCLRERFAEPLGLSEIAQTVGVHPAHLARTFRKRYGCSVGEYIRRLRIEHASRQLENSDTTISEIATGAGFFDQSHFTNIFKRQMGVSPAEYRRRCRRKKRPNITNVQDDTASL